MGAEVAPLEIYSIDQSICPGQGRFGLTWQVFFNLRGIKAKAFPPQGRGVLERLWL